MISIISERLVSEVGGCALEHLELNAVRSHPESIETRFKPFLKDIQAGKYKLIVALLNDAVDLLIRHNSEIPQNIPIVMLGEEDTVQVMRQLHPKSSAVMGHINLLENMEFGLKLFPNAPEVLIVLDPHDKNASIRNMIELWGQSHGKPDLKTMVLGPGTTNDIIDYALRMPSGSFIVFGVHRDYKMDGFPSIVQIGQQLFRRSGKPCFVIINSLLNQGAVGGYVIHDTQNAYALTDYIVNYLKFTPQINKTIYAVGSFVLDLEASKAFSPAMGNLPSSTVFLNQKPDKWSTYKTEIISTLLSVVGIIILFSVIFYIWSRKKKNQELEKLNIKLKKAISRAESASRAKSMFMSTMSHEIRTPLNAIIGFSEFLQNDGISREETVRHLKEINVSGLSLLTLINDMLELADITSNSIEIKPEEIVLEELCQQMASLYATQVEEKGLKFKLSGINNIPPILIDCKRLRQILLNIIGNALKFTHQGTVTVSADFEKTDKTVGKLTMAVTDTGIGIPKDKLNTIFEPFTQDDDTRNLGAYSGSGIGLAIVRRLLRHMKGSVTVKSEVGYGSTFTIEFPDTRYLDNKPVPSVNMDKTHSLTGPDSAANLELLLVDDIPLNLKVLSAIATRLGCSCTCVHSGKEVINYLNNAAKLPDWVLTDMWMPEIDGGKLASIIRENKDWKNIKIAIVTADVDNHDLSLGIFDAVIRKPITQQSLRNTLLQGNNVK